MMKTQIPAQKPFAEMMPLIETFLGEAHDLIQRHPAQAQSVAEEAIALLHSTASDTALSETEKRFALAQGYCIRASCYEQHGRSAEAIADADESVHLLTGLSDGEEGSEQSDRWAWHQSCAVKAKANALRHCGRSDEALAVMEAEVPILRFIRDETKRAQMLGATYNGIAALYGVLNEHALSLRYALDALTLHRENDNPRSEGASLMYIGLAQSMLGEKDAALDSFAAAMTIFDRLDIGQWQCAVRGNVSMIHTERGDYDVAEMLLQENLRVTQSRGDRHNCISTHAALGKVHRLRGDFPQSLRSLRTAERLS
ncbi:MAG: tetratricopeptide repeat protein [Armatimonadetes bacterium]|nr:tetratricopeptide repeat protein [Armatimonadota bacterium]